MKHHIPDDKRDLPVHERGTYIGPDIHHENCFGCGQNNPHGLHIPSTFDIENQKVRFEYTLEDYMEGAPRYAHGGLLATLLDEAQGVLCHHLGFFVMTDSLEVKYRRAVPLGTSVFVEARLTMRRRKRLYSEAWICSKESGEKMVESKARWYILPEKVLARKLYADAIKKEEIDLIHMALEVNRERKKNK